jgi:hypothetical protein
MAKEKQPERRRFEEKDRKPWTDEQRSSYENMRSKIAPFIRDLTTPPKTEKKKDFFEELFG